MENAYEDFKHKPTGEDLGGDLNVLPYNNYVMDMETGQVFVIDYTAKDGSVTRQYYRSDGVVWEGMTSTSEFIL